MDESVQQRAERSVPEQVIITPTDNGPLQVRGRFKIVLPSGQALETGEEAWLCRCGASQTKPFCDGTHSQIGFAAASAAVAQVEADDSTFQAVAEVDAVGEGTLLGVEVAGQRVVLGRVDGEIYAIGGTCTHRDAPLAEGTLEDGVVLCPYHQGGFNLKTGSAVHRPVKVPVPRYDVKVEGHQILVSRQPTSRETS